MKPAARTPSGAILLALAAVLPVSCDADPAPLKPPNILLVSIDSLRADHLGCYGYKRETSPVMDRFAEQGVRFETALAPTSWTLPSHVSLFTALPPIAHGVLSDPQALGEDALCLAEVLKRNGYATAGFVGGPFLRKLHGLAQGFDVYDDETVVQPLLKSHRGQTSPALVGLVENWLAEWAANRRAQPFFVFLHLWDVHYDYTPPPPFDRMFDPDYSGTITGEDFELGEHIHAAMDPRDLEHVVALYDGEICYTDSYLGQLLEFLDDELLGEETIVAITSDHGEEFFEHGAKGHRKNLYEATLRVPLLIRYPPRLPAGSVVEELARLEDVAPTLLGLAGIDPPLEFGVRGAPAGTGARDLFSKLAADGRGGAERAAFGDLHGTWSSIRTERGKLILSRAEGLTRTELFELRSDPDEQRPLRSRPAMKTALRDRLDDWKSFWSERPRLVIEIDLDEEQESALRDLGYIR